MLVKAKALLKRVAQAGEGDVPATLDTVLAAERREIAASHTHRYADTIQPGENPRQTYVGLALSGGGSRFRRARSSSPSARPISTGARTRPTARASPAWTRSIICGCSPTTSRRARAC